MNAAYARGPVNPGDSFIHYKGTIYKIIVVGVCEKTGVLKVVYTEQESVGLIWIRDYLEFTGTVKDRCGVEVQRFTKCNPPEVKNDCSEW